MCSLWANGQWARGKGQWESGTSNQPPLAPCPLPIPQAEDLRSPQTPQSVSHDLHNHALQVCRLRYLENLWMICGLSACFDESYRAARIDRGGIDHFAEQVGAHVM